MYFSTRFIHSESTNFNVEINNKSFSLTLVQVTCVNNILLYIDISQCTSLFVEQLGYTNYQVSCAIVIRKSNELEFGRVVSIYMWMTALLSSNSFPLAARSFCHHFHVFALVSESECKYLIKHKDLFNFNPFCLYTSTHIYETFEE